MPMQEVQQDRILRLTMLLHDVAKPVCVTTDEKGQNHFKGHPAEGCGNGTGYFAAVEV